MKTEYCERSLIIPALSFIEQQQKGQESARLSSQDQPTHLVVLLLDIGLVTIIASGLK